MDIQANVQFENKLKFIDNLNFLLPNGQKTCKDASRILIIGSPGCGKSSFIKNVCYEKRNIIYTVRVFCDTNTLNEFYNDFIPRSNIIEYSEQGLVKYIDWRKKVLERNKNSNATPWDLLIMDDCSYDTKRLKSKPQQEIYRNGRHFKMLYLLVVQSVRDVTSDVTQCLDGLIIFPPTDGKQVEKLFEIVNPSISRKEFNALLQYVMKMPYTCIWVPKKRADFYDSIMLYKTKRDIDGDITASNPDCIPKKFKFGSDEFRLTYNLQMKSTSFLTVDKK